MRGLRRSSATPSPNLSPKRGRGGRRRLALDCGLVLRLSVGPPRDSPASRTRIGQQDLSRREGARSRQPARRARRGAGADRRERRRQVDPDEDPGRRRRAERRDDPHRRRGACAAHGRRRHGGGHRLRAPGAQPLRQSRRGGQCDDRARAGLRRAVEADRPDGAQGKGDAAAAAARRRLRGQHAGRPPVARPTPARRDHQGAVARGAHRHHGRADLEPHRLGDGAPA